MVSGRFKQEFTAPGLPLLKHHDRYVRSAEFIQTVRGLWTKENYSFHGKHYDITDYTKRPFPVQKPGRPNPEIF